MRLLVHRGEVLAGSLVVATGHGGRVRGTFSYSESYVSREDAYPLDPRWPLHLGTWPIGRHPRHRPRRRDFSRRGVRRARCAGTRL